jgi:hypothetical protein
MASEEEALRPIINQFYQRFYQELLNNEKYFLNQIFESVDWIDDKMKIAIFDLIARHLARGIFFESFVEHQEIKFARRDFVMKMATIFRRKLKNIERDGSFLRYNAVLSKAIRQAWAIARLFDEHVLEFF